MKRIICLVFLAALLLSACTPRHISDIKIAMTKEDVISLWGPTNLISFKTVNGTVIETWEYHFATTDSVCWVTFIQDRVAAPQQCRRPAAERYY